MPSQRLLFITSAVTRSGAPMLMLHLIRWMRQTGAPFEMAVLLTKGGAMSADFEALLPTATFEPATRPRGPVGRWLGRRPAAVRRRAAAGAARCRAVVGRWPPDAVFCGSADTATVLDALGPFACPVVIGVHEMEYVLGRLQASSDGRAVPALRRHATHFVAGSRAVAANLTGRHGFPADRITVVHDFIPTVDFGPPTSPGGAAVAAAGVPAGAAVVGSVATVEWRKGADLFVALARLLPAVDATGRPVHFVWVGGGPDLDELRFDAATAGLADRVHVVGPTDRTADWYPGFDVLAVLSREDPFPLVPLEAAACGVPAVCFAGGGGLPEFVEADAGRAVPYLDMAAFAAAVKELLDDPAARDRIGRAAADKVRRRHDVTVAAPQVLACIRAALPPAGSAAQRPAETER